MPTELADVTRPSTPIVICGTWLESPYVPLVTPLLAMPGLGRFPVNEPPTDAVAPRKSVVGCVAADPRPKLVLAVDDEARSERLFAGRRNVGTLAKFEKG